MCDKGCGNCNSTGFEGGPLADKPSDLPQTYTLNQSSIGQTQEEPVMETNDRKPEKFALLTGINKYEMSGVDLRGCIPDVEAMWELLTSVYGFKPDNIRVLTDERATYNNIIDNLEWLVSSEHGRRSGDLMVWHHSGHGTQTRDMNGDEYGDAMDEVLVTYDHDWDAPLTDDIIADYFSMIPKGAFLTFIADTCHSGSMNRNFNPNKQSRFLVPPADIALRIRKRKLERNKFGVKGYNVDDITYQDQRHMLISGCRDDQTSADAVFGDYGWRGALTFSLERALKRNKDDTWLGTYERTRRILKADGFDQIPQLNGPKTRIMRNPFSFA